VVRLIFRESWYEGGGKGDRPIAGRGKIQVKSGDSFLLGRSNYPALSNPKKKKQRRETPRSQRTRLRVNATLDRAREIAQPQERRNARNESH